MNAVFADTSFYLAVFSSSDVHHEKAVLFSAETHRPVVVTEFVLLEVANALCDSRSRHIFTALLPNLRANAHVTIVPASQSLFDEGFDLYAKRPDKDWSLTDCISLVVMQQRSLTDALTSDHHFEQAGFNVLLK
jgi:hypothetical protein